MRQIEINFGTDTQVFSDWFDFADHLKQRELEGRTRTIPGWKYVDSKPQTMSTGFVDITVQKSEETTRVLVRRKSPDQEMIFSLGGAEVDELCELLQQEKVE